MSLPRMRGDRPCNTIGVLVMSMFTPHARGSTCGPGAQPGRSAVYPACAGIDLQRMTSAPQAQSLPRMRGDRPRRFCPWPALLVFTPHARGSTASYPQIKGTKFVYPACAGIDPR